MELHDKTHYNVSNSDPTKNTNNTFPQLIRMKVKLCKTLNIPIKEAVFLYNNDNMG